MHHTFRAAIEALDFDGVGEFFTDDIALRSPIARKTYRGRHIVVDVLRAGVKRFRGLYVRA